MHSVGGDAERCGDIAVAHSQISIDRDPDSRVSLGVPSVGKAGGQSVGPGSGRSVARLLNTLATKECRAGSDDAGGQDEQAKHHAENQRRD